MRLAETEMLVIPEHIEATGDYVIATYYLQTARNVHRKKNQFYCH